MLSLVGLAAGVLLYGLSVVAMFGCRIGHIAVVTARCSTTLRADAALISSVGVVADVAVVVEFSCSGRAMPPSH